MGKSLVIVFLFLPCFFLHSQITTVQKGPDPSVDSLQQFLSMAKAFIYQGQFGESIKFFKKALQITEETKNRREEPGIYNGLGGCYCELGDLSKGMEFYYKALQISEELGDKKEMANAYQYLGSVYEDLTDDSIALKHYKEALKINLETGNRFRYAQNNNSIAYMYARQGQFSTALKTYRESLEIYGDPRAPSWGSPWTFACIGDVYEWMGDSVISKGNKTTAIAHYEEALKNHLISLEKYKELDIPAGYSPEYLYVGAMNFKLNRIPEARKYLQTGLELLLESGTKERIAETYLYLSRIDSLEGNYKSAFRNTNLSRLYKDSVFNAEQSRKIALQKNQHEIEVKEKEINLLAAENKLNTAVAEKQKQQKIFAYAAIILIVSLSIYAFYRYRLRKKAETEKAKLKDRLHISQGLHDDIGSTLSSISVYTQVAQKLSEKNNKAELSEMLGKISVTSSEMISEMNDIVWTIHPKNDSMEKIIQRMESYAKPMLLTRNIDFILEYDPAVLSIHLEMEKRKNFYLVFKEAVNNAFKYSGCSEIITRIINQKGCMEMQITDNGVGFDVKHEMTGNKLTLSGNGLRNMKMRAEEMNGDLQINSMPETGTAIRLIIPIP